MITAVSKHNVFYRAIHNINIAALMTEMFTSDLVAHPKENVSDLYKQYRHMLKTLLDRQEPESKFCLTKTVSQDDNIPNGHS